MNNRKIIGIMACDSAGVIGIKGQMPWSYPEEFAYFYRTVRDNIIVMGRKTFNSLPSKFLKECICIVFSRNETLQSYDNVFLVKSLDDFRQVIKPFNNKKIFIVGGAEIATLFLEQDIIDQFLLTKINKKYVGDTFFPLNLLANWHSKIIEKTNDYQIYKFTKK